MTITPISNPDEPGRFYVAPESRPAVVFIVALAYREEPWMKTHPFCSCENAMTRDRHDCKHVRECVKWERKRLGLDVSGTILVCGKRLNLKALHNQMAEDFKDRYGIGDGESD